MTWILKVQPGIKISETRSRHKKPSDQARKILYGHNMKKIQSKSLMTAALFRFNEPPDLISWTKTKGNNLHGHIKLRDGKVINGWIQGDRSGVLMQIGLIPQDLIPAQQPKMD